MKKIMFMTMALLALAGNALAQGSIRTSDLTCQKGEQVELPLEITNDASLAVVGISFTLTLPEGVSLVIEDGEPLYELNSDRLNPKRFSVYTNQLDDGSWGFRVSTNSATAVLNGTEGEVMTLTLAIADDMNDGDYTIKLTENKLSIRDAANNVSSMPVSDSSSSLTIGNTISNSNSISPSDITCKNGAQVELPLEITNDASLAIAGISFTLALPEGVSVVLDDGEPLCELNSDRLNPKRFSVYTAQQSDGSWGFRISTNSATAVLNGTEGEVMTLTLSVADEMEAGDYSIKLTDNKFSIRDAANNVNSMPVDDASSTLTVESSDTRVVLDENSTTMPEAATGVDVLVKRTIKTGNLSTICLPFAMTGDQAVVAFGADAELADFAGYETTEDDEENITAILVKFTALDIKKGMEANHPYVIKIHTDSDVKEFTAEGVDIEPEDDPTVAAVKRTKKQWSELIGTYVADTKLEATTIFLNANKFWYSAGETKIKAFRAYFDFYDVLTDVESALSGDANIRYVIEEATGIKDIATDNAVSKGWFTIDGRKLNGKPAQRGIYILNGKKVRL